MAMYHALVYWSCLCRVNLWTGLGNTKLRAFSVRIKTGCGFKATVPEIRMFGVYDHLVRLPWRFANQKLQVNMTRDFKNSSNMTAHRKKQQGTKKQYSQWNRKEGQR